MKKIRVSAIVLIFVMLLCLCGCGKENNLDKTSLTADGFMDIMVEQGYNIYDISTQLTRYEDIKTVYVATTGDELYQIEFYELTDYDSAYILYAGNKMMFEDAMTGKYTNSHIELANFAKYTLTANGQYMVVSMIDNTMIYVSADAAFKDDIDAALKALGY